RCRRPTDRAADVSKRLDWRIEIALPDEGAENVAQPTHARHAEATSHAATDSQRAAAEARATAKAADARREPENSGRVAEAQQRQGAAKDRPHRIERGQFGREVDEDALGRRRRLAERVDRPRV